MFHFAEPLAFALTGFFGFDGEEKVPLRSMACSAWLPVFRFSMIGSVVLFFLTPWALASRLLHGISSADGVPPRLQTVLVACGWTLVPEVSAQHPSQPSAAGFLI